MLKTDIIILKLLKFIIFSFICVLIFTKYKIFQVKIHLKQIDKEISNIENEKINLNIQWSYLTNPKRLEDIYNKLQATKSINFEQKQIIKFNQIKTIEDLIKISNSKDLVNN